MSKDRSFATAIHILTTLAYQYPKLVNSDELAISLQTNAGLIRRMLSKLSQAGLVESTLGKGGGSTLKISADKISMSDIYLAVKDSPLFGTFEKDPFKACVISCNMGETLAAVFEDFEKGLLNDMHKVKLAQILSDCK